MWDLKMKVILKDFQNKIYRLIKIKIKHQFFIKELRDLM